MQLEFLDSRSGNLGPPEEKLAEVLEPFEMNQSGIRDRRVLKPEGLEFGEPPQVRQAGIGHDRCASWPPPLSLLGFGWNVFDRFAEPLNVIPLEAFGAHQAHDEIGRGAAEEVVHETAGQKSGGLLTIDRRGVAICLGGTVPQQPAPLLQPVNQVEHGGAANRPSKADRLPDLGDGRPGACTPLP